MTTTRMMFLNLPVRDLKRSMAFFANLGFEFNMQFTDEKAACMIVSDSAFVMLLHEPFFQGFTKRALADTSTHIEALTAFSAPSREAVDALADKAIAAGGTEAMPAQDMGFMYYRTFHDLDGHHWEVLWMDTAQPPLEKS